jgi:CBS domain-containing protein
MKATVRSMLEEKGSEVHTVDVHATVQVAIERMAEKDIGAVVVLRRNHAVGIFSERDHLRRVALLGRDARQVTVGEVMSQHLVIASPHWTAGTCLGLMTRLRVRHLPVQEGGQMVGIISIGDVVKSVISDQAFVIEQLEAYVVGSPMAIRSTGPATPPPL